MARRFRGTRTPRQQRYWIQAISALNGLSNVTIDITALAGAATGTVNFGSVISDALEFDVTLARTFLQWAAIDSPTATDYIIN